MKSSFLRVEPNRANCTRQSVGNSDIVLDSIPSTSVTEKQPRLALSSVTVLLVTAPCIVKSVGCVSV